MVGCESLESQEEDLIVSWGVQMFYENIYFI